MKKTSAKPAPKSPPKPKSDTSKGDDKGKGTASDGSVKKPYKVNLDQ